MVYRHDLDMYRIQNAESLKLLMSAGRGEITLVAPSEKCHTYRFSKPRNIEDFPEGIIFVSVLHEGYSYYLGMLENGRFRLTRSSRFEEDCESVKGAKYLVMLSQHPEKLASTKMRIFSNGRCCKCGRPLPAGASATDASVIGKSCKRKIERRSRVESR